MSPSSRPLRRRGVLLAVAALAVVAPVLAGCGSDDDSGGDVDESGTTEAAETTEAPAEDDDAPDTTEAASTGLSIVVTNDDGYDADGIDAVVEALVAAGHEVEVVAPLEQQSGTGGTFTDGPVETQEAETASGVPVVAVDGFPSDSVRVAIDELGLTPDLVVSGINEGQNLGQIVDVSGTVGAARAAVARDIPALALSAGLADGEVVPSAYDLGAELMIAWIDDNIDAILAGEAPVDVTSINIPSCTEGEPRELVEVPVATEGDPLAAQDCTSTLTDPADDNEAMANGFPTQTVLPDEPATPPQAG